MTQWKDRVALQKCKGFFLLWSQNLNDTVSLQLEFLGAGWVGVFLVDVDGSLSLQDEAPKTAQEWRRELPAEIPREDSPLGPPLEAPPDTDDPAIDQPDHVVEEESAPAPKPTEPGVEHVGIFSKHCKVTLEGQTRKFLFKTFLNQDSAVIAAAEFRRRCVNLVGMFEGMKRAPQERHDLLVHYGPWGIAQKLFCGLEMVAGYCRGRLEST